jgi:hypothetical protein
MAQGNVSETGPVVPGSVHRPHVGAPDAPSATGRVPEEQKGEAIMATFTANVSLDGVLEEALQKIRMEMQKALEKQAGKIIAEEVAKFSLNVAQLMSVHENTSHIVITIKKEIA